MRVVWCSGVCDAAQVWCGGVVQRCSPLMRCSGVVWWCAQHRCGALVSCCAVVLRKCDHAMVQCSAVRGTGMVQCCVRHKQVWCDVVVQRCSLFECDAVVQ